MDGRRNEARDHEADGHIDRGNDGHDRSEGSAALGLVHGASQHEIGDHDEHQNQIRRQPRLPAPPDAPLEAGPHLAGDHGEHHEQKRDLQANARAGVEPLVLRHEEPHGVVAPEAERNERRDGHGHVEVEDLLGQEHLLGHHHVPNELGAVHRGAPDRGHVEERHEEPDGGKHRARNERRHHQLVGPLPRLGQLQLLISHSVLL